ncbi:agmatine deiminase family protein [Candidatus Giovannonibacteria bacterium]|nr:agmatine deiminase family protein [Candidatus Giovannonibacteria bacterium]
MKIMPAEWGKHEASWVAWPKNQSHWPNLDLKLLWPTYAEIVKALSKNEWVYILVDDPVIHEQVYGFLWEQRVGLENVTVLQFPTDSSWIRDFGPIFIYAKGARDPVWVTDWGFNGWGKEYPPWDQDNAVPEKISDYLKLPCINLNNFILEGGAIDVNGQGDCLISEEFLLDKRRNDSPKYLEYDMREYLGVTSLIKLPGWQIAGDHTRHIDNIARFVAPNRILVSAEDDPSDENYKSLQENLRALELARDVSEKPFQIIKLPMPDPVHWLDGQRMPASYANFYIANGVVLAPTFQSLRDAKALQVIQEQFPEREVTGIDCRLLSGGAGTIHCSTMQQPA